MSGKAWTFRRGMASFVALLAVTLAMGTGCSSIDQQPFDKFSTAVTNMQAGSMNCMNLAYAFTRNDFIQNFVADSNSNFSSLQLAFPEAEIEHPADKQPLFICIFRARTSLQKLDKTFSSYASLLKALAGTKMLSSDELKTLCANINATATSVFDFHESPVSNEAGAFIGSAFSLSANLYLKHKTKSYLKIAINGNQPQVDKYANAGIKLIATLRETLAKSYKRQFESYQKEWNAEKTKEKKIEILSSTLDLDVKIISAMELLDILDRAYQRLPQANSDLAESVENNDAAMAELNRLYNISDELTTLNTIFCSLTTPKKSE